MTDAELIKSYIKIDQKLYISILVAKIDWIGAHEYEIKWNIVAKKRSSTSKEDLDKVVQDILSDHRYFCKCNKCGKKDHADFMVDAEQYENKTNQFICHTCLSQYFGVLF